MSPDFLKRKLPQNFILRRAWRAWRAWQLQRRSRREDPGLRLVRSFARAYPRAFFIQIGSNDGDQLDPLRAEILARRWRGIMVEPVPYVFERLRSNYGRYATRIQLYNVAIADRDGTLPFYHLARVDDYARSGLPRWYDALGSFNREVVLKHAEFIPDIADRIVTAQVPALSFETLCSRHGVQSLDLLHIDTEGYDYEILRRIDFARWRPRLLIYEHHHLSTADRAECKAHLTSFGYDTYEYGLDTWALRVTEMKGRDIPLQRVWDAIKRGTGAA